MSDRETFGPRLRSERERRGISLETIAAVTKVGADLWDGLERNDFSRWPTGIFARAFVRDYATAVGLDADEVVDEFCRLFAIGDRRTDYRDSRESRLVLRVAPGDRPSRSWSFSYKAKVDGVRWKSQRVNIGTFPAVSVAAAVARAAKVADQIKDGADPVAARKRAEAEKRQAAGNGETPVAGQIAIRKKRSPAARRPPARPA